MNWLLPLKDGDSGTLGEIVDYETVAGTITAKTADAAKSSVEQREGGLPRPVSIRNLTV